MAKPLSEEMNEKIGEQIKVSLIYVKRLSGLREKMF